VHYRLGASGVNGRGGGARCLGGAQPALNMAYIAVSNIMPVIFLFITVAFLLYNNNPPLFVFFV
jgi:hypothetical protein